MMPYADVDYGRELDFIVKAQPLSRVPLLPHEYRIITSALRIAARVMRPGVIGDTLIERRKRINARTSIPSWVLPPYTATELSEIEEVIRKALTDD